MLGYTLLAFLPTFASILLHVGYHVVLVDDLKAEDGFYYILQRYDALEASVLVYHQCYLTLLLEHGVEDVGNRCLFVEVRQRTFDIAQFGIEVISARSSNASSRST